jgi:hypothetical protein
MGEVMIDLVDGVKLNKVSTEMGVIRSIILLDRNTTLTNLQFTGSLGSS